MTTGTTLRYLQKGAALLGIALMFFACGDPLGVDTPRREKILNLDSLVSSDPFAGAPGDSIFALINGKAVVFATEVLRPIFNNRRTQRGHYLAIQATRYGLNARDYEVLSLRLDAIRDTGTYAFNAAYSAPKQFDSLSAPKYGAAYDKRIDGGYPESYITGTEHSNGTVRVIKIDEDRGVIVGTFEFKGYCATNDTTIVADRGAFRLQLKSR